MLPLLFEYMFIYCISAALRIRFIILLKRRPALNCFDFAFNVNQSFATGFEFRARSEFICPCPQHLFARADRAHPASFLFVRIYLYKYSPLAQAKPEHILSRNNAPRNKHTLFDLIAFYSSKWLQAIHLHCSNSFLVHIQVLNIKAPAERPRVIFLGICKFPLKIFKIKFAQIFIDFLSRNVEMLENLNLFCVLKLSLFVAI